MLLVHQVVVVDATPLSRMATHDALVASLQLKVENSSKQIKMLENELRAKGSHIIDLQRTIDQAQYERVELKKRVEDQQRMIQKLENAGKPSKLDPSAHAALDVTK